MLSKWINLYLRPIRLGIRKLGPEFIAIDIQSLIFANSGVIGRCRMASDTYTRIHSTSHTR